MGESLGLCCSHKANISLTAVLKTVPYRFQLFSYPVSPLFIGYGFITAIRSHNTSRDKSISTKPCRFYRSAYSIWTGVGYQGGASRKECQEAGIIASLLGDWPPQPENQRQTLPYFTVLLKVITVCSFYCYSHKTGSSISL